MGVQLFPGGAQLFRGGGGGLISIETHIACDFIPPLDPHKQCIHQMLRLTQPRSQAEAGKPGLKHHMSLDARYPDFVVCEQQRCRPACASAQSISAFVIRYLKTKVTRSDIS